MIAGGFGDREPAAQRNAALWIGAVFLVVAIATALVGRSKGPSFDPYLAAAGITWAICDLLTALFLFAQGKIFRRIDLAFVAAAYGASGLLTVPYLGAYFGLFGTAARTIGDQQIPATLYVIWHLLLPLSIACLYILDSRKHQELDHHKATQRVAALVAASLAIAIATTWLVYARRDALPHFLVNGTFQPAYRGLAIPLMICVSGIASLILVLRPLRRLGSLQVWLALTVFTSFLDGLMNETSSTRFSYAWDYGKFMTLMTSTIVMGRMLGSILLMYANSADLAVLQVQQAAARIRAIWQIATSEAFSEGDEIQVILDVATANIRPASSVFGYLSHLESGNIVIDAMSHCGDERTLAASDRVYGSSEPFPMNDDLHALLSAAGRTSMWNAGELPPTPRSSSAGWESAVGAPIAIATQTYFLVFGIVGSVHGQPLTDEDCAFVDVVASNISHYYHQRSHLERARYLKEHDTLTGLYNRSKFLSIGRLALRGRSLFAIVSVGLDHFGSVNEQFGQLVGDETLVEIAAALSQVDTNDVVSRTGGDEFGIVLRAEAAGRSLEARTKAYAAVFRQPFDAGDRGGKVFVSVRASLGAAAAVDGIGFDDLLKRANVALDEAKATDRGHAVLYSAAMSVALQQLAFQRDELLKAIESEELVLEYQPTYDLRTRSIVAAEALIRWQHPTRGRLAPNEFLDAAKRNGVMRVVTSWVIHRVVLDLSSMTVPKDFRCYVNVPAPVLEDAAFLIDLERELQATPGINTSLGLEVTESEVMNKVERAIATLTTVRDMGLRVAVDDFGTGHSSMSYLKRLPIDAIKLDRSYIQGLPDNPSDVALAELFLNLTQRFALTSVAEGVETEAQAAWLEEHGCEVGQGFLFSRPVGFAQLIPLLDKEARADTARAPFVSPQTAR